MVNTDLALPTGINTQLAEMIDRAERNEPKLCDKHRLSHNLERILILPGLILQQFVNV